MKISDEQIAAAVLSNGTNAAAAAACGLSLRQFYTRTGKPEFQSKLSEARGRVLEGACDALQARVSEAVETLTSVMRDKETPPQTRVNACNSILTNALRMTEQLEILKRVEALEAALQEEEENRC